jgi:hypothetical protein
MAEQSLKNHSRLVPGYHGLTFLLLLAFIGGAIRNILQSNESNEYSAWLLLLLGVILLLMFFFIRMFALKAQDRAIRAEESLRYFHLTGKRLDPKVRIGQIIALRFASDEELPGLVDKALSENLSNKEIKQLIKSWRGDYYRV